MSKILIRKEQEKSSTAVTAQCRKATIGDEKRVERYPKALAMLARIPMSICWTLLTIRAGYPFWMLSAWNWTCPICSAAKSI